MYLTVLINSARFFFGALLAIALSGKERSSDDVNSGWEQWKDAKLPSWLFLTLRGSPPAWVVYSFLVSSVHLILTGAATTQYTSPGGPIWIYPAPFTLASFASGIFIISFFAQIVSMNWSEKFSSNIFRVLFTFLVVYLIYLVFILTGYFLIWNIGIISFIIFYFIFVYRSYPRNHQGFKVTTSD